jgi:hypothetical protein
MKRLMRLDYPIVAIADLYGWRRSHERFLVHPEDLSEWP